MPSQFRPMLAETIKNIRCDVQFPVLASPKIDGLRCLVRGGKAVSRSLKPIRNKMARCLLESLPSLEGCDGELMVTGAQFSSVSSAFTREAGKLPEGWYFGVFDHFGDVHAPYNKRQGYAELAVNNAESPHIRLVPQTLVHNEGELLEYEQMVLSRGYEGVMVRNLKAPYKCGRSVELLKLKRFEDSEAEVIGATELLHNGNEATVSELGHTKRSSAKAGKFASGMLGALIVRDLYTQVEFEIGTGLSGKQRREFWQLHLAGKLCGRVVKYKHQEIGAKSKPRFPVFLGWRSREDMH